VGPRHPAASPGRAARGRRRAKGLIRRWFPSGNARPLPRAATQGSLFL
jgi:hypothetical protein